MSEPTDATLDAFIARWSASGAHERANYQLFVAELCDLLELPRPDPATPDPDANRYVFERTVTIRGADGETSTGFIDVYRRGSFVLETKQGADAASAPAEGILKTGHGKRGTRQWDTALERAYHQARRYVGHLPPAEGRPPFLMVCDVGHVIEVFAEFTRTGGVYERFPGPRDHRIFLADLRRPEVRDRLRRIWLDPLSLDPARHAAEVTREIAARLAELARSLEEGGHSPETVALFLQRCLFTLFAEDIGLLPPDGFRSILERLREQPAGFPVMATALWRDMATGAAFSAVLMREVAHFNGGLFEDPSAPALTSAQIGLLLDAARSDWSAVEPAIFGTLLERALNPRERHKLGAHYTPRAYVERLVRHTLLDPLRDEWEATKAAAALQDSEGEDAAARETVAGFHRRLCDLTVLDPACGSANFLYVTLELLKRLEGEVLDLLETLGGDRTLEMDRFKIRPAQFLGIEINARAAAIARLVLWIGYFQWHRKATGRADTGDRPLLPKQHTIERRDALLDADGLTPRLDPATGKPLTHWDGCTTRPHPVTGREVPDESARITVLDPVNPRRADWPDAEVIVGNPPFIGASRMRDSLGDGMVEALRRVWDGAVPESADFVMFWWRKAAEMVREGRTKRFGFITTNSIHQTFNRRVIEPFLADPKHPLRIAFAIPDHPWVDSADGAAVRIAMTVADAGSSPGTLQTVTDEQAGPDGEHTVTLDHRKGRIAANLRIGADIGSCGELKANEGLACPGVKLHGAGFIVTPEHAAELGLGSVPGVESHIRGYRNGKDLTDRPRGVMVIDLFGLTAEEVQQRFPAIYQHVLTHVKPERDAKGHTKDGKVYAEQWWVFGKPRQALRKALAHLPHFIATVETSKHRFFVFLDREILPDNMLVCIALDDAAVLAVLSSRIHVCWALAAGGRLGMGNDPRYTKSRCFDPYPFPDLPADAPLTLRLRELGERLDAHRKAVQAAHPDLTLTGLYNVMERLRSGEALTPKERDVHDRGLVTVLKELHDDIDLATLEAYGWSDLSGASSAPVACAVSAHRALPGRDRVSRSANHPGEPDSPEMSEQPASESPASALCRNALQKGSDTLPLPTDARGATPPLPLADRLARGGPDAEAIEQAILSRLVELNHHRAAEESDGAIRWLRPAYQNPTGHEPDARATPGLPGTEPGAAAKPVPAAASGPLAWPKELPLQVALIRDLVRGGRATADDLSARFGRKSAGRTAQIRAILETLDRLGWK